MVTGWFDSGRPDMIKDLSTPLIDAARERKVEFDRVIAAEMARSEYWYQWRHWWNKFCCWRFYRQHRL
jgi:hypothetical protein